MRLIPVTRRGVTVWIEDTPPACALGHSGRLSPGRNACPECDEPVRTWTCWTDGCTAPVIYDDEHVHHSRR